MSGARASQPMLKRAAPIEPGPTPSKIARQVTPALSERNTPPEADPTNTWRWSSATASTDAMRPIMFAGPMFRHGKAPP